MKNAEGNTVMDCHSIQGGGLAILLVASCLDNVVCKKTVATLSISGDPTQARLTSVTSEAVLCPNPTSSRLS